MSARTQPLVSAFSTLLSAKCGLAIVNKLPANLKSEIWNLESGIWNRNLESGTNRVAQTMSGRAWRRMLHNGHATELTESIAERKPRLPIKRYSATSAISKPD